MTERETLVVRTRQNASPEGGVRPSAFVFAFLLNELLLSQGLRNLFSKQMFKLEAM